MAKIRDILLPDAFNEALIRMLDHIPDVELVDFAKGMPGGFTRAPAIRQKFALEVKSSAPLNADVAELICTSLTGTIASCAAV